MKRNYLLLAILLLISLLSPSAMAQEYWSDNTDISWYKASDTEFEISTPQQLAGVAKLVNEGTTSFAGCTFRLKQDIDLGGKQWVPIGGYLNSAIYVFRGSIYGQGNTIHGLTINEYNSEFYAYIGLIGYGTANITIKDLTLKDVQISVAKSKYLAVGTLLGSFIGNELSLHSCHLMSGRVRGGESDFRCTTGGLVGEVSGKINFSDCSNNLTVIGGKMTAEGGSIACYTGGIAGYIYGYKISLQQRCKNNGEVVGGDAPGSHSYTGGLVGGLIQSALTNCYNTGNVRGGTLVDYYNFVGGIAGYVSESSITNSFAAGKLISGKSGSTVLLGGIAGYLEKGSLSNCLAIPSLIEGENNILRTDEQTAVSGTSSPIVSFVELLPPDDNRSKSDSPNNIDEHKVENELFVKIPFIFTKRIAGYAEEATLSNNYAYVPGDWNQDEIGADKLNGAEWSRQVSDAPICFWNKNEWNFDPSFKYMPKLKWEKWFSVANPYARIVSFDPKGGSYVPAVCVAQDHSINPPAAPTKDNYAFSGWYIDSECTTLWNFNDPVTADMTLYARWTPTLSSKAASFDMIATQVANGKPLTPKVTVRWFDTILTEGTDYTIAYFDNIKPGTGHARITGIGNYIGKLDAYFVIIDPMIVFSLDINEVEGITTNPAAGLSWLQKGLHRDLEIIADPKYSLANAEVYLNDQLIYPNEEAGYPFTRVIDGLTISLGAITENTVIRIEGIALKTPEEEQTSADQLTQSVKVTPLAGAVRIDAQAATCAMIYRTNGALEAIRPIGEGTTLIPLPAGIYLIRMEERSWKVVVKE